MARTDLALTPLLDSLAGYDPAMCRSVRLCSQVIDSDLPLLLLGETGVGKDTLARALHTASKRANKPFMALNCAAIPSTLLASELFGYAPGAFTDGAKGGYAGKLLASNGGTVFLDEIGDMPVDVQAYLLRVLEERVVTRLGCNNPQSLDVAFISATHRDLAQLVARGQFRRDLYFRIKGAEVVIPPLRARRDLEFIVFKMLGEECAPSGRGKALCPVVIDVFRRYDWPGNLRELRNTIRLTLALCEDERVTVAHLRSPLLEVARDILKTGDTSPCTACGAPRVCLLSAPDACQSIDPLATAPAKRRCLAGR